MTKENPHQIKIPRPRMARERPMIMNGFVFITAGCQISKFWYTVYTHLSSGFNGPGWKPFLLKYYWLQAAVILRTSR